MFYTNYGLITNVLIFCIPNCSSTKRPQFKCSEKHSYYFPQSILCNTLEIKVYLHMYADVQLQSLFCFDKLHFCVVPISPCEGIICFLPLAGAGPQYRHPQ